MTITRIYEKKDNQKIYWHYYYHYYDNCNVNVYSIAIVLFLTPTNYKSSTNIQI